MQSLRFIGHKSTATDSNSSIMDNHRNNLSTMAPATATSLGVHNSSPVITTLHPQQQYLQGSSAISNINTFADSGRGTTGPIAVNPILGGSNLGSPTRQSGDGDMMMMSPTSSNNIRLLADTSSAALMNVINNTSAMMINNQQSLVNDSSNSRATCSGNNFNSTSDNYGSSKLLINSLYRKGSRRRRLIQNPWDQLESMGLMSTTNLESLNPRYASRPELFAGHHNFATAGRHLRSTSSGSSNSNVNSDHVYECIDADSIHNYNILTSTHHHR